MARESRSRYPLRGAGGAWENGYAESFHACLRDEFLNAEVLANLREAKALGDDWRREYNHERPHSSLGSLTPEEFAAGLAALPVGATLLLQGSHYQHDQGTSIAGGTESGSIPLFLPPWWQP